MGEASEGGLAGLLILGSGENQALRETCSALTAIGVSAIQVSSFDDALAFVQRSQPDLLAVEVGDDFPLGVDAISRLRFISSIPIVALASPSDGALVARALEAGADGYLTAFPGPPDELRGRLAALRQGAVQRGPAPVSLAHVRNLTIDFDRCEVTAAGHPVTAAGHPVSLTPTEFRLVTTLVRAAGRVVSARQLLAEAQGGLLSDAEARDIVKVHMRRLRAKLEPYQGTNPYIVSVRGFGYLLERRAQPRVGDFLDPYVDREEA